MKADIHPKYGLVTVQCACGSSFQTRSTIQGVVQVDICSACHPFFTGKQKLMDTAGRIDRFKKKFSDRAAAPKTPKQPEVRKPVFGEKLTLKEKLQAAKDKAAQQMQ